MANLKPRKYRPLIRWHGGKWMIAPWIIKHFPRHHLYTEAFGGGASVLLRKPRAKAEVYNDLDGVVVQLFRVLRDPELAERLVRQLELTPYARDEFSAGYAPSDDPVETARQTIVRSFMGYGSDGTSGLYPTGFRANVTSHLKLPAQEWATYPAALRLTIERLKGVVIENCDAFDLLRRMDGPGTLHYADPPYLPSTRSSVNRRRGKGFHVYAHELEEADHVRLLELLNDLEGMVVVSGYPSELYDDMLAGWGTAQRDAYADGGRPRVEKIWINKAALHAKLHDNSPRRRQAALPGPLFEEENDCDGAVSGAGLRQHDRPGDLRRLQQVGG